MNTQKNSENFKLKIKKQTNAKTRQLEVYSEKVMNIIGLDAAREYLRVDYSFMDKVIEGLILGAQTLCQDVAGLSDESWNEIVQSDSDRRKEILRIAVLYTVGYLFEHLGKADYHELNLTLQSLLFTIREKD